MLHFVNGHSDGEYHFGRTVDKLTVVGCRDPWEYSSDSLCRD